MMNIPKKILKLETSGKCKGLINSIDNLIAEGEKGYRAISTAIRKKYDVEISFMTIRSYMKWKEQTLESNIQKQRHQEEANRYYVCVGSFRNNKGR